MGCRQSRAEGVQEITQSMDPQSNGNLSCNVDGTDFTLPETNSKFAPKNSDFMWFPIGISFSRDLFSGDMLVSGRVTSLKLTVRT